MLSIISAKFSTIKHNLFSIEDQPIGKAALLILFLLDLFILLSIFDGLSNHTRQLTTPSQVIPDVCRDIVIDGEWTETSRLTKLARTISLSRGSHYFQEDQSQTDLINQHSVCKPILDLVLVIKNDEAAAAQLSEWLNVKQEIEQLNTTLKQVNSAYDTSLLENIAGKDQMGAGVDRSSRVEALRKDFTYKTNRLNQLVAKQGILKTSLGQDKKIVDLFALANGITEGDRAEVRSDLRQLNFWYPVKRLGMEMIFLLPLFLVFYFWNQKSIAAERPFQSLVSTHLLVIVFIPLLLKCAELIYDIIPKTFLKQFIALLESLKLVALWHYLIIALTIIVALALVYLMQKKLFSQERLIEKRISKGDCQSCGKHLPASTQACPFCGFQQFKSCSHCKQPAYVFAKFCKYCGQSTSSNS